MPSPSPSPSPPGSSSLAMPAPIEAHGLGLLNTLADSPSPHRPDLESSYSRRGLLLWIVRVPDSKDMILTPLAPPRGAHSATAADIAACMYYVHMHHDTSAASTGVRATLIRRVPATGEQWNVADICDPEAAGSGSTEEVVLEMLGGGYRRLAAAAAAGGRGGVGAGVGGGSASAGGPLGNRPAPPASGGSRIGRKPVPGAAQQLPPPPPPPPQELPPLVRTMKIEGEGFWHRLKSRRKKSDERIDTAAGGVPGRKKKKKKRDYVFDGLWVDGCGVSAGRCEFKDEGAGKYLKCKYYPAAPPAASAYHPPPEPEKSTLLSVIEFKLGTFNQHKRTVSSSSASHNHHHIHRDKQKAKMGMLIVHGPGQEMLDLLVAANMAAFMKRWEGWARERNALGGF